MTGQSDPLNMMIHLRMSRMSIIYIYTNFQTPRGTLSAAHIWYRKTFSTHILAAQNIIPSDRLFSSTPKTWNTKRHFWSNTPRTPPPKKKHRPTTARSSRVLGPALRVLNSSTPRLRGAGRPPPGGATLGSASPPAALPRTSPSDPSPRPSPKKMGARSPGAAFGAQKGGGGGKTR